MWGSFGAGCGSCLGTAERRVGLGGFSPALSGRPGIMLAERRGRKVLGGSQSAARTIPVLSFPPRQPSCTHSSQSGRLHHGSFPISSLSTSLCKLSLLGRRGLVSPTPCVLPRSHGTGQHHAAGTAAQHPAGLQDLAPGAGPAVGLGGSRADPGRVPAALPQEKS